MAGALSTHQINAYQPTLSGSRLLFASTSTPIVTSGAMSFNPQMHGSPFGQNSFQFDSSSFMDISQDTAVKIATLQAKLNQKLGPEFISQRPGPGGGPKLTYAEGWKVINLANEVFGFNGWSSNVVSLTTDFVDYSEESRRYNVGVTAVMKVTLRDGVYHEDVGYGMLENSKSKAAAIDKCKKEAVTDGLKRALRSFGNLLGNCLYDKAYTQEIVKMKVPPPKLDKSELYRRPEFEERPAATALVMDHSSSISRPQPQVDTPTRPPANQHNKGPLPTHVRAEMVAALLADTNQQRQGEAVSSSAKGKASAEPLDLQTSVIPQLQVQRQSTSIPPAKETAVPPPAPEVPPPPPANNPQAQAPFEPETEPDMMEVVEDAAESESYPFSEDDAFLATVDLGDLGRPIDFEEGHGGQEESLDDTSLGLLAATEAHCAEQGEGNAAAANLCQPPPPPQPQEQGSLMSALGDASSRPQQSEVSHPKIFPHQRRYLPQRIGGQGNATTTDPASTENAPLPKIVPLSPQRPRVTGPTFKPPSMGGFHFPPGVQNPLHQAYKAPTNASPGSTIGVKRPADALSSNPGAPLRKSAGLGMGLQQAPQGQGGDGDSKRLKR